MPGPGNPIYGLEVCEFLNMDKEFVYSEHSKFDTK